MVCFFKQAFLVVRSVGWIPWGPFLDGIRLWTEENGEEIDNTDLDEFHGHFGADQGVP